jgi:hypothetical protein
MLSVMNCRPSFDDCLALLHTAGWSVGDAGFASGWLVTGANGENRISAIGATQAEAWRQAVAQARALGMLGRSTPARMKR